MLAGCAIACVGFSAAALFVVPMALGTAAQAGLPKKTLVLLELAPAIYPLVSDAVGHNFRRILAWLRDFWRLILIALIAAISVQSALRSAS